MKDSVALGAEFGLKKEEFCNLLDLQLVFGSRLKPCGSGFLSPWFLEEWAFRILAVAFPVACRWASCCRPLSFFGYLYVLLLL